MKKKNNIKSLRKKKIIVLSLLAMFSAASLVTSTIAWFKSGTNIDFGNGSNTPVVAASEAAYFGGGDGSSTKPFKIQNRTHLYNLAWLQYIGYFDGSSDSKPLQPYFILEKDIDMSGMTLPPIGTELHPFLGNFDGNNKTISNLTVSNADPTSNTDFGVAKPTGLVANTNPEIVGFFGVVGQYTLTNLPASFDSSIIGMENFTLNSIIVNSRTTSTLIGLAAGYVDGIMSGVKVGGNSKLDLGNTAKTKIDASFAKNLSDYALVGYSTNIDGEDGYSQELSEYYEKTISTGGGGDEWGGSINFLSFNERLKHYLNSGSVTIPDMNFRDSTHYSNRIRYYQGGSDNVASLYRVAGIGSASADNKTSAVRNNVMNAYYAQDPVEASVLYPMMGTFNNETVKFGNGTSSIETKNVNVPGTIQPLIVDDTYQTADNNTGYMIGGHVKTVNNYGITAYIPTITSASYEMRFISNAIGDTYFADSGSNTIYKGNTGPYPSFDNSKLEILTNKTATYSSSNFVYIKDEYNASHTPVRSYTKDDTTTPSQLKLIKYANSRATLSQILGTSSGGSASFIHGLHFRGSASDNASAYINTTNTLTTTGVKVNGQTVSGSYTFPTSCIDFNLKEDGVINLFAGSYHYTNTTSVAGTDSFFSLWKIERNTSNGISSLSQIKKIYKANDSSATEKYKYDTTTNGDMSVPSGYSLAFDLGYLTNVPPVQHAVYYFEIPVSSGEYAIGVCDKKAGGAYLMYLDIGASGEQTTTGSLRAYSITTNNISGTSFPIGVDFALKDVGNGGGETLGVNLPSNVSGNISFSVNTSDANNSITIVPSSSGIANYAFQGSRYPAGTSPGDGEFSVVDTNVGAHIGTVTKERVLIIDLTLLTVTPSAHYRVKIIDQLADDGSFDEADSTYLLDSTGSGNNYVNSDKSTVTGLSNGIDLDSTNGLRNLTTVAMLTRETGSGEFTTSYLESTCSFSNKTIDVSITPNGTTMTIEVTDGYTFKIDGGNYSSPYPAS